MTEAEAKQWLKKHWGPRWRAKIVILTEDPISQATVEWGIPLGVNEPIQRAFIRSVERQMELWKELPKAITKNLDNFDPENYM